MGRLFFTGDVHGHIDIGKIQAFAEGPGKNLTKQDVLIVAGDMGVLWSASQTLAEKQLIDWYTSLPFTVAFIDGNHENHDRLDTLSTATKWGRDVGVISYSLFHLRRGRVYTINDSKIWTMGGGYSIDKFQRKEFLSWWRQELPSLLDSHEGKQSLDAAGRQVDYIVTHAPPRAAFEAMNVSNRFNKTVYRDLKEELPLQMYLQEIAETTKFTRWFFGHLHEDIDLFDKTMLCLYERVVDQEGNKII